MNFFILRCKVHLISEANLPFIFLIAAGELALVQKKAM